MKQLMSKATELLSGFTYVEATCHKTVQEKQYEPYGITFKQGMIVPVDDRDEAFRLMAEELDQKILQTLNDLGIRPLNNPVKD